MGAKPQHHGVSRYKSLSTLPLPLIPSGTYSHPEHLTWSWYKPELGSPVSPPSLDSPSGMSWVPGTEPGVGQWEGGRVKETTQDAH